MQPTWLIVIAHILLKSPLFYEKCLNRSPLPWSSSVPGRILLRLRYRNQLKTISILSPGLTKYLALMGTKP